MEKIKFYVYVFSMILFMSSAHALVINEIMYDPAGADSGHEWVELYNEQAYPVDMTGYRFSEGGNTHSLSPVMGTAELPAGSYAIIAEDSDLFLGDYPDHVGVLFDSSWSSLSNTGEMLEILDPSDNVVDFVNYSSEWGGFSNYSLELIDASLDNELNISWMESLENGGTPGELNSVSSQAPEFSIVSALITMAICVGGFLYLRKRD